MDYKEEQQNEIDALDSIYCGEMTGKRDRFMVFKNI